MKFHNSRIEAGRRTLNVATNADGSGAMPPLLLLNGIGFNTALLEGLAQGFAGRRIVIPDMPGCGGSPDPALPYAMACMASDMTAMMDTLYPGEAFDCLGFSWGGALAQQIAVQAQNHLRRLVLVSTTSGVPLPLGDAEMVARLMDPREYTDPRRMSRNLSAMLKEGGAGAGLLTRLAAPTPSGVTGQIMALAGWSVLPLLPFVRAPVLIMGTSDDIVVPVAHNRFLRCALPSAEMFELESGGHLAPLASPERVLPRLKRFFGAVGGEDRGASGAAHVARDGGTARGGREAA
ncbi:alpha/beta fold hydrolase [Croceicoccus hydrothermalis]|uniref:alpha/beta fold hydrolase n=1 Tax=Croceicoccus hydrothermalis TaxID=2867964 RepID=UPI001EFB51B5|nr:alpha/beta hydrolase [Croceicoccus hydrothermalis]